MSLLPGWPLVEHAISFQTGPTSSGNPPYWLNVTPRTIDRTSVKRGRQYELDQVQTGEAALSLYNTDGAFDPQNASSPYYPYVLPYRAYRHRAQYPATVNLLTAEQATGGAVTYDGFGNATAQAASSAYAPPAVTGGTYYGGNNYLGSPVAGYLSLNIPTSATVPTTLLTVGGFAVIPSVSFAFAATVQEVFTSGHPSVKAQISWYNAAGSLISSVTSSAVSITTTNRVSVTGTAPANAAGAVAQILLTTAPAATSTLQTSTLQVEQNTSASTYVQPSPWYPVFNGFVERWPQSWIRNGAYGVSQLQCVDAFGWLSQRPLLSPAYHELLLLGPNFAYFLDEPSTATQFIDATGNRRAGTYRSILGGTSAQGSPGATLTGATATPKGISGPVATFNNLGSLSTGQTMVIDITAVTNGQAGTPTTTGWTRTIAYQSTVNLASSFCLWTAASTAVGEGVEILLNPGTPTTATLYVVHNSVAYVAAQFTTLNPGDGNWHYIGVAMSADGKTCTVYFDNVTPTVFTSAVDMRPNCTGGSDFIGAAAVGFSNNVTFGFVGEIAMVGELPFAVTSAQWQALYSAFQYGGSGLGTSTSASSYQDRLRWASWNGPQAEDNYTSGQTTTYGPSTDLNATRDSTGTDALSALQAVVDTESGAHYVARDGTVTLKARRARYNQTTPAVVFGENVAGGEIPYQQASFGYDPTRISNDAQMTQVSSGSVVRSQDPTSQSLYGDVQLQRNINSTNLLEVQDAGTFLVGRYKNPAQRLESLTVGTSTFTNPAASGAAWAACLALELGSRVRVMRRPPGATAIQFDGFVESIAWAIDDAGNATVDFEISSSTGLLFWQLDSATYSVLDSTTILGY